MRLHPHPLGEDRLVGGRQRGFGGGEIANVVGAQELLIGLIRRGQFVLERLTLGLYGGRGLVLEDLAAIGQILVDDRVQHPRRQGGVVALVGQTDDGAQRRHDHVQTRPDRANGVVFLLGAAAGRGLALLEALDAHGAHHAALDLGAVQDRRL
ncbi:hypothetical protein D3C72_1064350 [compost metagenome]